MTSKTGRVHLLSDVKPNGVWKHHVAEKKLNSRVYIKLVGQVMEGRTDPMFLGVDGGSFHGAKGMRRFLWQDRGQLRSFYQPTYSPTPNADENVW
jgi:hypothetical protein